MSKRVLPAQITIATAVVFGFLSYLAPDQAGAVKCSAPQANWVVQNSDIIFRGEIVGVRNIETPKRLPDGRKWTKKEREFTVLVGKVWKGELGRNVYVKVREFRGRFPPLRFKLGQKPVIAARLGDGGFVTNWCLSYSIGSPRHIKAFDAYAEEQRKK